LTLIASLFTVGFGQTTKPNYLSLGMTYPKAMASAQQVGRMLASQHLNISVSLNYRDPDGMKQFVDSVSDPHSPNYRHFITPAQVGQRFGPTPATIESVKSYLKKFGMNINLVADNGLSILADATVSQAEAAFQTQICEFTAADGYVPPSGHLYSYVQIPSLPLDIQPNVVHIGGLESFTHPHPNLVPLTPLNVQTIYNVAPMLSSGTQGQGRNIAISSWDGYRLANVAKEYSTFGLPTPSGGVGANITVKTVSGGCGGGAEAGEADLDIQSILGVAPLCHLIIYDGGNSDLIGVLTQEANDNTADVISESYGWELSSSMKTAAHNLHLSMNAAGITYMSASGDSGTSISYYYPDIDPEVLTVGGTEAFVDGNGNRAAEYGWAGSGGGWIPTTDSFNILPSYQAGTGVPTTINYRLVPDVALNADPYTGYEVYMNGGFQVIGGTSGASPTFAGSLGVSEQQLIANGALPADGNGHQRLGRVNDVIYGLNGDSSVFYDVTTGSSNGKLPNGQASNAGVGWDTVTGWGAMNFTGFVTKLSGTSLSQFSLSQNTVEGGQATVTGTVATLTPAPSGGTTVTISGGDSAITYSSTVTIAEGAKSATFSITSSAVSANHPEALTATVGSSTKTANLMVTPTAIASVAITPGVATGPSTFSGTVTLVHAAPSGGDTVTLTGGDSSVTYPSSVTIPSGSTSATFSMTSKAVGGSVVETITGTLGSSTKSASVTLTGLGVTAFTISPTSVIGGTKVTGTITLTGVAGTGGVPVALSGGDSSVSYPSTVTVPAKASSVAFSITTYGDATSTAESITATLATTAKTATVTVLPPTISTFTFTPAQLFGGQSTKGVITLTGPAGSAGMTVSLSGADSNATCPSSVTIASGATSASFTVTTSTVASPDNETIVATLGSKTASSKFAIEPAGIVSSVAFAPTSVVGGVSSTGTVYLTGAAGPGGVTVTLSGGDSSVTYPSTVAIPAGVSSKTFAVTTKAVGTSVAETITAKIGPSSAKGTLTITSPVITSFSVSPAQVYGGQSSTATVTLSGVAPTGGTAIAITGGDSNITYGSTLTIAAGASSGKFTITSQAVSTPTNENLKATLGGKATSAILGVEPNGVVAAVSFAPTSVIGGASSAGTVTLTGPAGPGGVTVTLSGGDSSVSYPSSIAIAAGAKTKTFSITSSAVNTNVTEAITATIGVSSAKGALTVTTPTIASVTLSPTTIVGGKTSTGTVTLTGTAGSSGVTVKLSGGTSAISYPATVTVAAGAKSATFTVTSSAVSANVAETITARLGTSFATASAAVDAASLSSITSSQTSVSGSATCTGTVTLSSAAGSAGDVVKLVSNSSTVTVPSTVTVSGGSTTATFTVTCASVTKITTVQITATFGSIAKVIVLTLHPG
jgi:hypothetical protein